MNIEGEYPPPTEEEVYEALGLRIDADGSVHTKEETPPPPTVDTVPVPRPTAFPGDVKLMKKGFQLVAALMFVVGFGVGMQHYSWRGNFEGPGVIGMGIAGLFLLSAWLVERFYKANH